MEETHKTHQDPAWGWIGALAQARAARQTLHAPKAPATHGRLIAQDCPQPVAQACQSAS